MRTGWVKGCDVMNKPFSQACANNRQPILEVLRAAFGGVRRVLEIGSGTGQHAVYCAEHMPWLHWQTSDLPVHHPGINAWIDEYPGSNVARPVALDVSQTPWPVETQGVDAVFTANTCHIMPWSAVELLFWHLPESCCRLAIYGPMKYRGDFTSDSNRQFDQWLKSCAAHQGIRDFEALDALAGAQGFRLLRDHDMPANNQLLLWARH